MFDLIFGIIILIAVLMIPPLWSLFKAHGGLAVVSQVLIITAMVGLLIGSIALIAWLHGSFAAPTFCPLCGGSITGGGGAGYDLANVPATAFAAGWWLKWIAPVFLAGLYMNWLSPIDD